MKALIIGGTSGLGFELAQLLINKYEVAITGRKDPKKENLRFIYLDLSDSLPQKLDQFIQTIDHIDLLIYAAGFYQEGTIGDLSDEDIIKMEKVGLLGAALLLQRVLKKQKSLPGFIAITSTSQWTPRLLEPMYTAVKAGLGMLANSVSLDPKIGKVLLAAPAGMTTNFWTDTKVDTSTMMDPKWVAEQILNLYEDDFEFKYGQILRNPPRVEIVEKR